MVDNLPEQSPAMVKKQWLVRSHTNPIEEDYLFNIKKDVSPFFSRRLILDQTLGEGSYGQVFKALNKKTNQMRAIKIIAKSRVKNEERLKNEIEIMSTLVGRNVRAKLTYFRTTPTSSSSTRPLRI